jgi:hypothetical protein
VCTSVLTTISGSDEICDGLDNDCDGSTDEDAALTAGSNNVETITIAGAGPPAWSFDIFAYEASRPDSPVYDGSNYADIGHKTTAACSVASKNPWTMVDWDTARAACQQLGTGWDLCTAKQWRYACAYGANSGTQPHPYPYGDDPADVDADGYSPTTCNGQDYNASWDHLIGCAVASNCFSDSTDWGATLDLYDLSGNVEEWTLTSREIGADPVITLYEIRGGSYNDLGGGLSCDFDFWAAEHDFAMPNLGFRCCNGDDPVKPCDTVIGSIDYTFEGCSDESWTFESEWEFGLQAGTGPAPHGGTCYIGTNIAANYSNGQDVDATAPSVDMTLCAGETVLLNWWMWYETEDGFDFVSLEAFDGSTWHEIDSWTGGFGTADWDYYSADISAYINAAFQFRFRFYADSGNALRGAYIDDVSYQVL